MIKCSKESILRFITLCNVASTLNLAVLGSIPRWVTKKKIATNIRTKPTFNISNYFWIKLFIPHIIPYSKRKVCRNMVFFYFFIILLKAIVFIQLLLFSLFLYLVFFVFFNNFYANNFSAIICSHKSNTLCWPS